MCVCVWLCAHVRKMALASGQWLDKEVRGEGPSPRWVRVSCTVKKLLKTNLNTTWMMEKNCCVCDCGTLSLTLVSVWLSRHGHALAVAGNVAFVFGGASSINQEVSNARDLYIEPNLHGNVVLVLILSYIQSCLQVDKPVYFNDFYMLTGTTIIPTC